MNKNDVMWQCPKCGRIVPDSFYIVNRLIRCDCQTARLYQFSKFILDKDDNISVHEKVLAEELEKSYRDGYSRGFEEGADEGYSKGYNDGYKKAIRIY